MAYSATYHPTNQTFQSLIGFLKLVSFIGSAALAAFMISNSLHLNLNLAQTKDQSVVAQIPIKYTYFPDVGNVFTPHIEGSLIGTSGKIIPTTFLLDSGAKISALPMKYVKELNVDTSTAKRIYLRSATNTTTYGYLTNIGIQLEGSNTITIPVTFAEIIEPLLGTFGFFDHYTIIFDHVANNITIKGKS